MKKEIKEIIDAVNDSTLHQTLKDGIIDRLQDQTLELYGQTILEEVGVEEAIEDGYIVCELDNCIDYLRINGFTNFDSKPAIQFLREEFKQNAQNIYYGIRTEDDFVLK